MMKTLETRGRKPKDTVVRERKITIKVSEEELERMEILAEYLEIPKTVLVRNIALLGLEEIEEMKSLETLESAKGVIKTSDWLERIINIKRMNNGNID